MLFVLVGYILMSVYLFYICRVCGKMEPGDARVGDAVSSLSALLRHNDVRVADAALRCFASLADRFARAHTDPAPLAEHGSLFIYHS